METHSPKSATSLMPQEDAQSSVLRRAFRLSTGGYHWEIGSTRTAHQVGATRGLVPPQAPTGLGATRAAHWCRNTESLVSLRETHELDATRGSVPPAVPGAKHHPGVLAVPVAPRDAQNSVPPMGTRGSVQLGHSPALLPGARYHRGCPVARCYSELSTPKDSHPLDTAQDCPVARYQRGSVPSGGTTRGSVPVGMPGGSAHWGTLAIPALPGGLVLSGMPGGSVLPGGAPRLSLTRGRPVAR